MIRQGRVGAGVGQDVAHALDKVVLANCRSLTLTETATARALPLQARQGLSGLLDHPVAHAQDQARGLGNGDEAVGRDVAAHGVVPAHQQLAAHHVASAASTWFCTKAASWPSACAFFRSCSSARRSCTSVCMAAS